MRLALSVPVVVNIAFALWSKNLSEGFCDCLLSPTPGLTQPRTRDVYPQVNVEVKVKADRRLE
jgi:hypothetical protein